MQELTTDQAFKKAAEGNTRLADIRGALPDQVLIVLLNSLVPQAKVTLRASPHELEQAAKLDA